MNEKISKSVSENVSFTLVLALWFGCKQDFKCIVVSSQCFEGTMLLSPGSSFWYWDFSISLIVFPFWEFCFFFLVDFKVFSCLCGLACLPYGV